MNATVTNTNGDRMKSKTRNITGTGVQMTVDKRDSHVTNTVCAVLVKQK